MGTLLVCTIGHSNRSIGTFVELLRANEIVRVLDVRTVPRSRHNPQFNRETLAESMGALDIGYTHLPGLGGLRHARARFPQQWLEQSLVSRLCGLHAVAGVRRQRSTGRGTGNHRALRVDVCRSGPLALPSVADRRRTSCSGRSRRGHHRTRET